LETIEREDEEDTGTKETGREYWRRYCVVVVYPEIMPLHCREKTVKSMYKSKCIFYITLSNPIRPSSLYTSRFPKASLLSRRSARWRRAVGWSCAIEISTITTTATNRGGRDSHAILSDGCSNTVV